jgi:hypothetical protein
MQGNLKTKKYEINNFIGIFDNYFPDYIMDAAIKWFKQQEFKKKTYNRLAQGDRNNLKSDTSCSLNIVQKEGWAQEILGLPENIMMAVKDYLREVPLDQYIGYKNLEFNTMKIQKTVPGGGYHLWHIESCGTLQNLKRVLVYSLYLNDVEEGGETEFLYQSVRVKPVRGRMVIWPASFPFVHRGNPPLKKEKYILTSWLSGEFDIGTF